ncbi:MAG: DNA-directed RNA polymerase subunit D [Candidatus Bathyarchaeia archaeon]
MEVVVLEGDESSIRFVLKGIDTPLANALRRIMIAEVPSMAIDDVIIIENSSPMYDEVLAHRLGHIPLKTDLDTYVLPEKCECQSELGCSLCRVILTLVAEASDAIRVVYSGDLMSEDPKTVPVSDKIPIVKLAPGQEVRLEAYARLGYGRIHAKWQPVSASTYKYVPAFHIDHEKCDGCESCVMACPRGVLGVKGGRLEVVDPEECTTCKTCEKACPEDPPAIKVGWLNNAFVFYVETTGALPPERVVVEATRILREKVDEFIGQFSKLRQVASNEVEDIEP